MVKFGSFQDIGKVQCDEVWLIVRSLKAFPQASVPVLHIPDLSPSWQLFTEFQNKKNAGQWNKEMFENWYKPRFLKEMCSEKNTAMLQRLKTEAQTKDILCCCFCPDESMCHRSIIRQLLDESKFALLIAGSRTFNNYEVLCKYADYFLQNQKGREIIIVSGGARGADALAEQYAKERGYTSVVMKADWDTFGKSAGYRRNEAMHQYLINYSKRGCLCFWDGQSKGTAHNFELVKEYNTSLRTVKF